MVRGLCILLMVLSLCACGTRSDLPESESVPSRTEWTRPEEESAGQTADDLPDEEDEKSAADEPSAQGIPESEESGQVQAAQSPAQDTAGQAAIQTAPGGAAVRRCSAGEGGNCRPRHGNFRGESTCGTRRGAKRIQ